MSFTFSSLMAPLELDLQTEVLNLTVDADRLPSDLIALRRLSCKAAFT